MKRFGQMVLAVVVAAGGMGTASAQSQRSIGLQGAAGVTFGNKTDASFGGEFDFKLNDEWELFLEGGQMRNVAPGQLEDDAQIIATAIDGSAATAERANYYNVGVKYLMVPFGGGFSPYVGLGFGAARVQKDVTFSVGGRELTELQLLTEHGVQLGADLSGATIKPMFLATLGMSRSVGSKAFVDLSYRYGLIFAKSGVIEDDKSLNTNRVQVGFGVRF
jgi:opacity protein-like surface antigen